MACERKRTKGTYDYFCHKHFLSYTSTGDVRLLVETAEGPGKVKAGPLPSQIRVHFKMEVYSRLDSTNKAAECSTHKYVGGTLSCNVGGILYCCLVAV